MPTKWIVDLAEEEEQHLKTLIRGGKPGARKVKRAQILLGANGGLSDGAIVAAVGSSKSTVHRVRQQFVEEGMEAVLSERKRGGGYRLLNAKEEALLVSIACSKPPEGRARWTLVLLAEQLVTLTDLESVSYETVRRRLKENELKPWQKKMWCIPKFDANYVARMEHILDLYAQPPEPKRPVVNFDEAFKQLVEETRSPIPAGPGHIEKYDYEYKRNGTANIFLFFDRHRGWRKTKMTERKGNVDFAECMRDLVDVHYPDAEVVRVVLDNLSTHREGALYKAFPPAEARRILRRLEFHYTPKHASWLNMVEIEIGVMNRQCLSRRIGDRQTLEAALAAWEKARNDERATINWMFDVDNARVKMTRAYEALGVSKPL